MHCYSIREVAVYRPASYGFLIWCCCLIIVYDAGHTWQWGEGHWWMTSKSWGLILQWRHSAAWRRTAAVEVRRCQGQQLHLHLRFFPPPSTIIVTLITIFHSLPLPPSLLGYFVRPKITQLLGTYRRWMTRGIIGKKLSFSVTLKREVRPPAVLSWF